MMDSVNDEEESKADGAIVFPFTLGIRCLDENGKTVKYSGSCIHLT